MNWLPFLLVALPLCGLLGYQQWLHQEMTKRWMRLFSEQQGIPPRIMEKAEPEPKTELKKDGRRRISIPVPRGPWG